jgi:integrase
LTGQRRGEIGALEGSMVDFMTKTITLPSRLTKNKREHRFPFGTTAEAILCEYHREGFLFPAGDTDNSFSAWSKSKTALDKATGTVEWTLHDLRRTFATQLAALGTPIHVTEKLLNHVSGTISGVAAIYNRHAYMDEMRAAIEAYEHHLADLSVS